MIRHKKTIRYSVLISILSLVLVLPVLAAQNPPANEETFSCFIYDEAENRVDAFWSDKEQIWYLFVPSTVSIPDMPLFFQGEVAAVAAGTLESDGTVVTGAFQASGDRITLEDADGTAHTVQVMQSNLPSVHIVLNGTTLEKVHQDKDEKHKNNSVYIMDPDSAYDLTVEGSVEMKGRGNTSWQWYEKKGYQIKFDSKTSVLGMGKAKKWVLLANASDDSMMRTSLTYRMAEHLDMAFVPGMEYVDLWINGEYRGTYLIGDKVEPGSSRLDLQHDQGAIFEHDEAFYLEEDHWVLSEELQRHFVLKEIVEEEDDIIEAAKDDFAGAVDEMVRYIRSTLPSEATLEELNAIIDVDSFIKYYLVTEYVLNREAIVTSFYWYKDGPDDVIHLGPIWDYDTCMGNDGTNYTEYSAENHPLFTYLFAISAFHERAETLKTQYWSYLTAMDEDADVVKSMIKESAGMNYLRWDSLGKPVNKDGSCFADTFDEAVLNVQTWLQGREQVFDIRSVKMINTSVSDRCDEMEICYDDDNSGYTNVKFAVWHDTKKQSDLRWYSAARDADGILRATADLKRHQGKGLYYIDAYTFKADGSRQKIATGQAYVKSICVPDYTINTIVSDDCKTMTISYTDINPHEHIRFAVWSKVDGQDDLRWYPAQSNGDGEWTCAADLRDHNSAGTYHIHGYSITNGVYTKLIEHEVTVSEAVGHSVIETTMSNDFATMEIVVKNVDGYDTVRIPVWSSEGGQDDLRWYDTIKNGDGSYSCTVDLRVHNTAGEYVIHVYGYLGSAYKQIGQKICYVEQAAASPIRADVSADSKTLTISYTNPAQYEHVHFAVWSKVDGQDDLRWYPAQSNGDGEWTCAADLRDHNSAGTYHIHGYSITGDVYTKLVEYTVRAD